MEAGSKLEIEAEGEEVEAEAEAEAEAEDTPSRSAIIWSVTWWSRLYCYQRMGSGQHVRSP